MKDRTFKTTIAPALVLVIICLVITAALAGTYSVASPIIEKNAQKTADEARAKVLPAGDSFTQYDGKLVEGVTECYFADNKAGMAVTATYKSFGGTLTAMVGVDQDGKVTGVTVTEHADTPGLGTKAMDVEYLKQYGGVDAAPEENIKNDANIDQIVGATISSNAIYHTVQEALQQFKECGGVK
ncbi:FMN-binding protein [Anaerovorax odorimutans]|uniref:Ion-translocating oxidoreductase complex subunit G n=1 Tax=Anaerovorax odorimutans TaxID=109327 RepID=A0ABT1RNP0_9FIRM|nr:FMN-binding protein [Anaerovorax odorimutans]MCQ4636788.1 FMN-binding protein [Anaerovorax odorimutans]